MKEKEVMHLSVRQRRAYEKALKIKKEQEERIAYFEKVGTMDTKGIIEHAAKTMWETALESVPEDLKRKAVSYMMHTFVTKSPRGRKPHAQAS